MGARAVAFTIAAALAAARAAGAADPQQVERGRYLVENVAMCPECHTPRTEDGELDRERWLEGGPHGYRPVHETPDWEVEAPALAGLPGGYTEEKLVEFLTTGVTPRGRPPKPPMKSFRMTREDAAAVAAYLESLKKPPK